MKRIAILCLTILCSLGLSDLADADRYCGIYSVYGAAASLGRDCEFSSLINEEYVSRLAGSTTEDLLKAISSLGLHGTPVWRLSGASLCDARDPMILHVCSEGQLVAYNHWLLFLGQENGMAWIAEGEQGVVQVPMANILSRWDGVAVAVHVGQQAKTNFNQSESRQRSLWFLLAIILIAPFAFFGFSETKRRLAAVACFIIVMGSVTGLRHGFASDGFFRNADTLAYVDAAFSGGKFETMTIRQIEQAIDDDSPPGFTIIDARDKTDFALGAIPGAINIPVDSNSGLIEQLTKSLDRDKPVVVYCQSSGCSFDRIIAIMLVGQGFTDIRVCDGGWIDWQQAMRTARLASE